MNSVAISRSSERRHVVTRREFVKKAAWSAAAGASMRPWSSASKAQAASNGPADGRKIKYVGWQVGVTYQATAPGGLDRDSLMRLVDEMANNRMNLLSLMMASAGHYDPNHDGFCWPVRNPRLKHFWDSGSINGQPSTEFVREVIAAAADRGIEVQLFTNWGIWNPKKIRAGYPSAVSQVSRTQAVEKRKSSYWTHCPDSPGAWQAGLDTVADLLTYYNHPNVISYAFERLSYGSSRHCYCRYTQEKYRQVTGSSIFEADAGQLESWKLKHISDYLKKFVEHIKRIRPKVGVWLHTQCSPGWGHDPARMKACGIDYLSPHTIQFRDTREGFHQKLERLAPNPCVLHFCTRDRRPQNYPLWIKTPEIITQVIDWVLEYPGENITGLLFFNPNATSARNRKTVYEQIKRFQWS